MTKMKYSVSHKCPRSRAMERKEREREREAMEIRYK